MDLPERFIHQTTRYVMGRRTGSVQEHCIWLVENWGKIPEKQRNIIQQDLEEAFGRDDRARQMGTPDWFWLGDDCDRRSWEQVRVLYATSAKPATKKRGRRK